jgi:hypothetical protein
MLPTSLCRSIREKFVRLAKLINAFKNTVFWDVALCRSCVTQHFGGTYRLQLQGRKILEAACLQPTAHAGFSLTDFSTLKMEAIRSSEMSAHTRTTRRHIPEDAILHSHSRENFKSYMINALSANIRTWDMFRDIFTKNNTLFNTAGYDTHIDKCE